MKLRLLWVFVVLASLVSFVHAELNPMGLPKLTQYVTDFAGVLTPDQQASLESIAQSYDKQTSNQIVAVLIPHRNGNELFDIGMNVFNTNAIWQAGKNNGLLLVISTQEKKIRIIVWYGLEWEIPDLLASRIIEEDIRPLVNNGDFAGAVQKYYERILSAIDTGEGTQYQYTISGDNDMPFWIIWVAIWFVLAIFLKPTFKKPSKKYIIFWLLLLLVVLTLWLSTLIFVWVLAGLFFWFTWTMPGRWWFWWFSGGWGSFGWGWFSGGWGSSGWGWAGD